MTRQEKGCVLAFVARLKKEEEWVKRQYGVQWRFSGLRDRGVVDYDRVVKEPIRFRKLGKLLRRVTEWTHDCVIA